MKNDESEVRSVIHILLRPSGLLIERIHAIGHANTNFPRANNQYFIAIWKRLIPLLPGVEDFDFEVADVLQRRERQIRLDRLRCVYIRRRNGVFLICGRGGWEDKELYDYVHQHPNCPFCRIKSDHHLPTLKPGLKRNINGCETKV